jgi:hypothetical protein
VSDSNAGAFSKYFITSRTPPRKIVHQFKSQVPALGIQASIFEFCVLESEDYVLLGDKKRDLLLLPTTAQIGPIQVVGPNIRQAEFTDLNGTVTYVNPLIERIFL